MKHSCGHWAKRVLGQQAFSGTKARALFNTESSRGICITSTRCHSQIDQWRSQLGRSKVIDSPYPDVDVPKITYPQYVFNLLDKHRNNIFMVNGETGAEYSYHNTLREISRVSSGLIRDGLRPGDRVAFFSFNKPEYIISWFAATAVGAVVTDANPTFTAEELCDQLEKTGAKYLFAHSTNAAVAKEVVATIPGIKQLYVFGNSDRCKPYSELAGDPGDLFQSPHHVDPSEVSHLPCSSGTTGLPKQVQRSHTNLIASALVTDDDDIRIFGPGTTNLMLLPMFHMYCNFLTGVILINGSKMVLQERFSPEKTLEFLQNYKITGFPLVPPLALFLASHPLVSKYDLSSLKVICSGAAPVSPDTVSMVAEKFNLAYLGQGYGATEMCPITLGGHSVRTMSAVGFPVRSTKIKVVSLQTGEDLDLGGQGEIYARGPQIMSGYENNEEATNSTLVDGWLKTGDIGYVDNVGLLHIVDRLKDFIKVKGHQVAPAELEALLLKHEGVQDAAVIGVPHPRDGEAPRAFVVLKDKDIGPDALKEFVAKRCSPEKHLTGGVIILKEIPKTASGKILKKDLRSIKST